MDLCAKCLGNAGELRGMSGESMGVGTLPEECRRIQGNAMERMDGCKVPGECRVMPSKLKAVGEKCKGNAEKYREIPRERIGGACKPPEECREMPGECKGVGGLPRGMQRNAARKCMEIGPK